MGEAQTIDDLANRLVTSLGIRCFTPYFGRDRYFLNPDNEKVPIEAGSKFMEPRSFFKIKPSNTIYLRVGEFIFLDDRLKERIDSELLKELQNRIIYLHEFDSALGEDSLMRFSALTIYALAYNELQGKTILDLGSADGVLSLVAKRKGARKIIVVDNNLDMANKLLRHVTSNNMRQSAFGFLPADVRNQSLLMQLPLEEIQVVVANLGPEYGSSHLCAIDMLDHLPNVHVFIGGGYVNDNKDRYGPQEAFELLSQKGFRVDKKIVEADQKPRLAFIAERQYQ